MITRVLVLVVSLAVAAAAYAASPAQGPAKGFTEYSSVGKVAPCPCPVMKEEGKPGPCPRMTDAQQPCPCPAAKEAGTPCPRAKKKPCPKKRMHHRMQGKAPCYVNVSGAGSPCPLVKGQGN